MTGFEPGSSRIVSDRSANCATTTSLKILFFVRQNDAMDKSTIQFASRGPCKKENLLDCLGHKGKFLFVIVMSSHFLPFMQCPLVANRNVCLSIAYLCMHSSASKFGVIRGSIDQSKTIFIVSDHFCFEKHLGNFPRSPRRFPALLQFVKRGSSTLIQNLSEIISFFVDSQLRVLLSSTSLTLVRPSTQWSTR